MDNDGQLKPQEQDFKTEKLWKNSLNYIRL